MAKITRAQVQAMAPNANAFSNGSKIAAGNSFCALFRTEDGSFYMGECSGSGSARYRVSADFSEGGEPICRCSCPSRQFPCKHSLALLLKIADESTVFSIGELPEEIVKKRNKRAEKNRRLPPATLGEPGN